MIALVAIVVLVSALNNATAEDGTLDLRLAYVVPSYESVVYLYEAPAGATVRMVTCEAVASGSWFGPKPWEMVALTENGRNGYAEPVVYRATAPGSGRLYVKATAAALEAGRVFVSLDDGQTWQTAAGPECRNTVILPMVKMGDYGQRTMDGDKRRWVQRITEGGGG